MKAVASKLSAPAQAPKFLSGIGSFLSPSIFCTATHTTPDILLLDSCEIHRI